MLYGDFKELFTDSMRSCGMQDFGNEFYSERFFILTECLLDFNSHTNLTAVTDPEEIIVKHYADSLRLCTLLEAEAAGSERRPKLADVGCGAGFPSLPVAVTCAGVDVYALDSTQKKLNFIDLASQKLGLSNIRTVCGRAEDLGAALPDGHGTKAGKSKKHQHQGRKAKNCSGEKTDSSVRENSDMPDCKNMREKFDFVCARAVAPLNRLCEYCLPLCAPGGKFFALKGQNAVEELEASNAAVEKLGGGKVEIKEAFLDLRGETLKHYIIIIQKTAATPPIYPRTNAVIQKNPL